MKFVRTATIKIHTFFRKHVFAQNGGIPISFLSILLLIPGVFYFLVTCVKRLLYENDILGRARVDAKVIGIGNLTVGGTGKTTVTMELAEYLQNRGVRVAVLTRGYGARSVPADPIVVSRGTGPLKSVDEVGDEAYMMAERLINDVIVIVGKDRRKSALLATREFDRECLILDDSFQYHPLYKNLEILLINEIDLLGKILPFPSGPFREPLSSAKSADVVVLMRGLKERENHSGREEVKRLARRMTTASPSIIQLRSIWPKEVEIDPDQIRGARIVAFTSIARTDIFTDMVRGLSPDWFRVIEYPDHFRYSPEELTSLRRYAEREDAVILTTEKDRVKIDLELFADRKCYTMILSYRLFDSDSVLKRAVDGLFDGAIA